MNLAVDRGGRPLGVRGTYDALDDYARTYGELPLRLLLHAAVPQSFRADLLNLLKVNFVPEAGGDLSVDADVLLSPLVEATAAGYFRFDPEVRRQSLDLLDAVYRSDGSRRSIRVARFLIAWLDQLEQAGASGIDPLFAEYAVIQRWGALALIDPPAVAAALARSLSDALDEDEVAVRARLGGIAAALSIPLAGHQLLISYTQGIDALRTGNIDEAQQLLEPLGESEIRIGDVTLRPAADLLDAYLPQKIRRVFSAHAREDRERVQPPGGTIRVDSQFYIRRPADDRIEAAAQRGYETVVIKGPRQVGKSSLLIRYLKACADAGRRIVYFDFQRLSNQQLDDYPILLTEIAQTAAEKLDIQLDVEPNLSRQMQLTHFIEDTLIPRVGAPITLAFDEVDRVLGRPYQSDFFSMLRLWHNQRAEPFSVWVNVNLALVISTEPYLLIDSADQSPFNVTTPIELGPFSRQNLDELNACYGGTLSAVQLDRLFQLLGGQPYLTRLAYFRLLVDPGMSFDELDEKADDISGPFGEHLHATLFWLGREKELLEALKQVINNRTVPNENAYLRLRGAGLAVREDGKTLPSNLLYARFFKKAAA